MKLNFEKLKSPAIKAVIVKQRNRLYYIEYKNTWRLINSIRSIELKRFKLNNYEN